VRQEIGEIIGLGASGPVTELTIDIRGAVSAGAISASE